MENKINKFQPFIGTTEVSFGQAREIIRKNINKTYKCFTRNEFSTNSTDYYEGNGYFVEYDDNNLCEAIEFTNKGEIYYEGNNLVTLGFKALKDKYDSKSNNKEIDDDETGVFYYDLGFGFSRFSDSDEIDSLIIFSKTYWD